MADTPELLASDVVKCADFVAKRSSALLGDLPAGASAPYQVRITSLRPRAEPPARCESYHFTSVQEADAYSYRMLAYFVGYLRQDWQFSCDQVRVYPDAADVQAFHATLQQRRHTLCDAREYTWVIDLGSLEHRCLSVLTARLSDHLDRQLDNALSVLGSLHYPAPVVAHLLPYAQVGPQVGPRLPSAVGAGRVDLRDPVTKVVRAHASAYRALRTRYSKGV